MPCCRAWCPGLSTLCSEVFSPSACVGFCEIIAVCSSVSSHLQPSQTAEIKLLPALNANFNKSHFCVCFFSPYTNLLLRVLQLSSALPFSPFLSCSCSLFICPFTLRCFAAHHGRLSRLLQSVVIPWPCDDCVLYQSVTCVLAQPLPAPCTLHVDPCAVAALTVRRAA